MKPWIALLPALALLAACTTTSVLPIPGSEPNLKEAARLNTQLGLDYWRKGEVDLALEKLKRAIEQDPDLALAHSSIALVYARKGDAKMAQEEYEEAMDLNSDDPDTLNNFGVFLCGNGERADAEKNFLRAAKASSYATPEVAWTNAGICARGAGDFDKSERFLREALRINPQYPEALGQMAWVLFNKKDFLRTRAFLQRYEAVARSTPEALWVGVQTERVLGDRVAELSYARRLKKEFPDSQETYELIRTGGKR